MAARAAFLGAALATSGAAFAPPRRLRAPPTALRAADATCDVAVVGAGPAGSALAWLLGERQGLEGRKGARSLSHRERRGPEMCVPR